MRYSLWFGCKMLTVKIRVINKNSETRLIENRSKIKSEYQARKNKNKRKQNIPLKN